MCTYYYYNCGTTIKTNNILTFTYLNKIWFYIFHCVAGKGHKKWANWKEQNVGTNKSQQKNAIKIFLLYTFFLFIIIIIVLFMKERPIHWLFGWLEIMQWGFLTSVRLFYIRIFNDGILYSFFFYNKPYCMNDHA